MLINNSKITTPQGATPLFYWLSMITTGFALLWLTLGTANASDNASDKANAQASTQQNVEAVAEQKRAMRIVALAPHLVELLFAIGAGNDIVAAVDYANHPEAAKQIPRIGGHQGINIEKLVLLEPDLVLFWQGGNQAQDLAKMQSLGINVKALTTDKLDVLTSTILQLGEWTGRQVKAQQVTDDFTRSLSQIRQQYASKQTLKVFYSLWSEPLMTINKDSWISDLDRKSVV